MDHQHAPAKPLPLPLPRPQHTGRREPSPRTGSPPASHAGSKHSRHSKKASHEHGEHRHHHIPHHPHRTHRHHRDASTTQLPPSQSRTSAEPTPAPSRDQSRRQSFAIGGSDAGDVRTASGNMAVSKNVRQAFTEADLQREKELDRKRNDELRKALTKLNADSNSTTRRLDDTYYSILEQISTLQTTVSSLQELASLTGQLHQEFEDEAIDLETEVKGQTLDLSAFGTQQRRVEELEARVKQGKERVGEFVGRLDAVRARIEEWERREGEWQALMSRRLRMLFGVVFVSLFLLVALLIFHYSRGLPHNTQLPPQAANELAYSPLRHPNEIDSMTLKDLLKGLEAHPSSCPRASQSRNVLPTAQPTTPGDARDPLHVFDEL